MNITATVGNVATMVGNTINEAYKCTLSHHSNVNWGTMMEDMTKELTIGIIKKGGNYVKNNTLKGFDDGGNKLDENGCAPKSPEQGFIENFMPANIISNDSLANGCDNARSRRD